MKLTCKIAVLVLWSGFMARAQTFTFADTYPVSNLDSLERWLKTHPQPTLERLKNLIRAERTYPFIYREKLGTYQKEITRLATRFNHNAGLVFHQIKTASANERFQCYLRANQTFEALRDTSGMIYTLALLCTLNFNDIGVEIGNRHSAQEYIRKAEALLLKQYNVHDYLLLQINKSASILNNQSDDKKHRTMTEDLLKAIAVCESNTAYNYALIVLQTTLAVAYYWEKNHAASYQTNRAILQNLRSDEIELRAVIMQNIANECEFLGRYSERLQLCDSVAHLLKQLPSPRYLYLLNLYISYKEEYFRKGDFKDAALYGDSVSMMQDSVYNIERSQALLNLQTRYETSEKEKKIAQLNVQQTRVEYRARLITILLGVVLLVAVSLTYLLTRLRRANAQLRELNQAREQFIKIIAHDLRNPLQSFFGISTIIRYYLQKNDQAGIAKVSASLEQTGRKVLQMLDNLMYWAIAPKGQLLTQFANVPLAVHIESIVDVYRSVSEAKGIQFTVNCPEHLNAWLDPNAFDLILRNLVDNAIKHVAPNGQISIEAGTNDQGAVLSIADNGNGMSAQQLETVRQVLAKPDVAQPNAVQHQQDQTGLGMIIVGKFARSNRITITVESTPALGTCFILQLPTATLV